MAHRLRRHNAGNEQYRVNKIFCSTPDGEYQELAENPMTGAVPEDGNTKNYDKKYGVIRRSRHSEGVE